MRAKLRNASQKQQARSLHEHSPPHPILRNKSHFLIEEHDPGEALCRLADDPALRKFSLECDGIAAWEPTNRQPDIRNELFLQREIKPHEKRAMRGRLEPICGREAMLLGREGLLQRDIEKCSTKDTISYLKQMLFLLRSSRETAQPPVLQDSNQDRGRKEQPKEKAREAREARERARMFGEKENEYNDAEIVSQLKHGLTKLPSIHSSKKSTISIRARRGSRFTLDKLLI